jgi:hypothetical protein
MLQVGSSGKNRSAYSRLTRIGREWTVAKQVRTIIVSDISGDDANDGESVEFTYRGVSYAIDLTKEEADTFDQAMDVYTAHAQRQGGRRTGGSGRATTDRQQLQAVREWARANGHTVSDRGRVSQQIQDVYKAAH